MVHRSINDLQLPVTSTDLCAFLGQGKWLRVSHRLCGEFGLEIVVWMAQLGDPGGSPSPRRLLRGWGSRPALPGQYSVYAVLLGLHPDFLLPDSSTF